MSNSTLNMINVEIAVLKERQETKPLDIVEVKKLETLVRIKKDLLTTPAFKETHEQVDEDVFTDEEIEEFLVIRQKKLVEQEKKLFDGIKTSNTKKAPVKKKKKAAKKTKEKVS